MAKIGTYSHAKLLSIIRLLLKNADITSFPQDLLDQISNPGLPEQKKSIEETVSLNPNVYLDYELRCDDNQLSLDITTDGVLIIPEDSTVNVIPCDAISGVPENLGVTSLLSGNAIEVVSGDQNSPTVNVKFSDLDDPSGGLATDDKVLIYDTSAASDDSKGKLRKAAISDIVSSVSGDPASKSEPYVTIGNSSALSHERALAATSNTGITLTDGGANGSATLAIDINSATDAGNSYSLAGDDLILIADSANSNTVKKLKMSLFTGGDVKAASAFATDNVIMVCNGTAKTIGLPDTTMHTNGQNLEVRGTLAVSDTSGNEFLEFKPDYAGEYGTLVDNFTLDFTLASASKHAYFQINNDDIFKLAGSGTVQFFPGKKLEFNRASTAVGGAIYCTETGGSVEVAGITHTSGLFYITNNSADTPIVIANYDDMAGGINILSPSSGGSSSTIIISNENGTAAGAIDIITESGGITLNADEGITVTSQGSAPSSTGNKIYNHSGDLYWAGNKLTVGTTTVVSQTDTDNRIAVFGGTSSGSKIIEGISGFEHDGTTFTATATTVNVVSNAITYGTGADTDIVLTFNGNTKDGVLTWMEDEDYFKFDDDIFLPLNEKMYFAETDTYIQGYSAANDGTLDKLLINTSTLDLTADTIDLNADTITLDADVVENTLSIGTTATTMADGLNSKGEASGEIIKFLNTTTVTCVTYYLDDNSGSPRWSKVDADDSSAGSKELLAIALGTNSNTNGMLIRGYIVLASGEYGGTAITGSPLYIGAPGGSADGYLSFNAPSTSGNIVRIAGYCIQKDSSLNILVYFNPSTEWIERA